MSRRRGTQDAGAHSHSHSHSHDEDDNAAGLGILNHGFDDVPRRTTVGGSHAGHSHSHSHLDDDADDISPLTRQVGTGADDSSPESSGLSPTTPAANGFGHPPAPSSPYLPLYPPTETHGKGTSSAGLMDDPANHSESYDALPPLSPLPARGAAARLSAAEVKAQRHERIHSRNLSIFFPRPGALSRLVPLFLCSR
jgi:hypothetical protein